MTSISDTLGPSSITIQSLVTIKPNGVIEYGPNYTPDAAAKAFWEALGNSMPEDRKRIAELMTKFAAAKAELAACREDAARLKGLLELGGYYQDGSHETIRLYQDECTRTFHVAVGKRNYYGPSWEQAIDAARKEGA